MRGLYAGVTAVVIGNALKAGVRFTTYDQFKSILKDDQVGGERLRHGTAQQVDFFRLASLCSRDTARADFV